jgi:hypothetical protein
MAEVLEEEEAIGEEMKVLACEGSDTMNRIMREWFWST